MTIFAGIVKVFPIRIEQTNCEKNCNSVAVDNFAKLYVLVYVFDDWILFTVIFDSEKNPIISCYCSVSRDI